MLSPICAITARRGFLSLSRGSCGIAKGDGAESVKLDSAKALESVGLDSVVLRFCLCALLRISLDCMPPTFIFVDSMPSRFVFLIFLESL